MRLRLPNPEFKAFILIETKHQVHVLDGLSSRPFLKVVQRRPDDQMVPVGAVANALPQALILTAIVIGFAMTTFVLVLLLRTYAHTGTLDVDEAPYLNEAAEKVPVPTDQDQTLLGGPS